MGLIKAALGGAGGVLADQWLEFFYCESLPENVMAVKGKKRVSGRSSNTRGEENIISNGSGIAVADGQCMIIVEQGKILDFCAEPGQYTFDISGEPSLFSGGTGGMNAQNLFAMGQPQQTAPYAPQTPPSPACAPPSSSVSGWNCNCGHGGNTGKFCAECGKPQENGWACSCGAVNKGRFCAECGKPKPAGVPQYKCDKCGWEPADKLKPPKFCPECGDPFDDGDVL